MSSKKLTSYRKYVQLAQKRGADTVKIIDTVQIVVGDWVRYKCQYGCGGYADCLTCPPYSPSPEATRRMLSSYSKALLMQFNNIPVEREDEFCIKIRELVYYIEKQLFYDGYYKAFGMGAGPCPLCEKCNTTNGRCKNPRKARPAMEACGIDVYQTVRNCGLKLDVVRPRGTKCSFVALVLIE
jgi:predicted metal-binding protein